LIKHRDQYAGTQDIAEEEPYSIVSRRLLADIAREGRGNVEKAATGDPAVKPKSGRGAKSGPGDAAAKPQRAKRAKAS
jgi:hypothetical protein